MLFSCKKLLFRKDKADSSQMEVSRRSHMKINNDRDKYGGMSRIHFEATGFFRIEYTNGRWWLITPEGNAFLSFGLNHIGSGLTQYRWQFHDTGSAKARVSPFFRLRSTIIVICTSVC